MLLDGGQLSEGGGGVIHGAYRNVHINPVKHTEAHTHTRLVSLAWSSSELHLLPDGRRDVNVMQMVVDVG